MCSISRIDCTAKTGLSDECSMLFERLKFMCLRMSKRELLSTVMPPGTFSGIIHNETAKQILPTDFV